MCGIVTIIHKCGKPIAEVALKKIRHRGLNATSMISFENFYFGFNRLSINDKSEKGNQPFEFGHFIGVFNGEIYNYRELKSSFDISTTSGSDTEIILPLFEKLGNAIIDHLDGFYSGIIFNKLTKRIFFIRDYIGKKPLFYGINNNFEFIVSELKAIENIESFQSIPKGLSELISGNIETVKIHKVLKKSTKDIREAVISAIKKRIPNNEKQFGVFLSGGLDSSIIAKIVSTLADNAIYYTLGNKDSDDLKFVRALTEYLDIEKKIKIIGLPKTDQLPELINKVVYHTESYNPSIISNGLATYLLSREAKKDGINVVLSGEGADELFCGYPISKNPDIWFEKRNELIENMSFTELRRLDLSSMAHTIEVRCPFLDKNLYEISNSCALDDLIIKNENGYRGKQILRDAFKTDLPKQIIDRNKISFDVGSGIRKSVVEYLTRNGNKEKEKLKEIWINYFPETISDHTYFHSYPTFDSAIEKRGAHHK